MNRIIALFIICGLFLAAGVPAVAGSGNRTGTGGASQLLIPVGARDLAMGGSTVSTTSGVEALFWNPAGVAKMDRSATVLFSHMEYIADIGVEYGAVAGTLGDLGSFALSVKSLSIGSIDVTTTASPDGTGETYSPQYFTAGLTYSRKLSDRIAVGITTNIISERITDVSASGVAFNVGVIYDDLADFRGLSLGIAVKNIGPQMRYDGPSLYQVGAVDGQNRPPQYLKIDTAPFELPSSIEIGMGYRSTVSENANILFAGTFQSNNFSEDEYRLGIEAEINNMFYLRGGYSLAPDTPDEVDYLYGFTVGGGISYDMGDADLSFDYAYRDTEFFSGNHIIAVRIGF